MPGIVAVVQKTDLVTQQQNSSGTIFSEKSTIPVYSKHLEGHPIEAVLKLHSSSFLDIFVRTAMNVACFIIELLCIQESEASSVQWL